MRTTDHDQAQQLGRKVEKPAADPKPPEKVREGIYKGPDGKFFTEIPEPPSPTIWDVFKQAGYI